ncbi:hypothetical protein MBLNU459_g3193t1 [Dothideomycetes sp. NU459]
MVTHLRPAARILVVYKCSLKTPDDCGPTARMMPDESQAAGGVMIGEYNASFGNDRSAFFRPHAFSSDQFTTDVVPTEGHCSSCGTLLRWADLVQDLSLRLRGEKEVAALFKERKSRKRAGAESLTSAAPAEDGESEDVTSDDDVYADVDDLQAVIDSEDVDSDASRSDIETDELRNVDDIRSGPGIASGDACQRVKKSRPEGDAAEAVPERVGKWAYQFSPMKKAAIRTVAAERGRLPSINRNKVGSVLGGPYLSKELANTVLELLFLIPLFAKAATLCSVLGGYVKKEA